MNGRKYLIIRLVVFVFIPALVPAVPAMAVTRYVPSPYPTIQGAIDASAVTGDEIEVAPGTYNEAIDFNGKAVRLYSSGGPQVTTIDAQGAGSVVTCDAGEGPDTVLEGFTITGGTGTYVYETYHGGGMFISNSSPTVKDCVFSGNVAPSWSSLGGGIYIEVFFGASSPTVTGCVFTGNVVNSGAGLYIDGFTGEASAHVVNCLFYGNSATLGGAGAGGGICNSGGSLVVANCTISDNSSNWYGGGISNSYGSLVVCNSVVWDNGGSAEIYIDEGTVTVKYTDVQGGYEGVGNINVDPMFVNPAGGNLRVGLGSSCIDAGDNNSMPADTADLDNDGDTAEPIPFDLDGGPRVVDGNGDGTATVDMGAYELPPPQIHNITQNTWYGTIQAAIDDANNGDEIEVAPGTYNEAINFKGKAVRLYSSGGPEVTTIDANGLNSSVVTCNSSEDANTVLEGFTITGGNTTNGGGMYNNKSDPTVTNCTFSQNTAGSGGAGGGIYNEYGNVTVTNCTFSANTAGYGAGIFQRYEGSLTVTNCAFINNSAGVWGGGMYNQHNNNSEMTNCTFGGNSALGGGGIYNYNSSPTVTNCILWGDTPNEIVDNSSTTTVTYSDVQGGWPGTGNIDADPLFVDAAGGDLRLSSNTSPCVDAGDNNTPGLPATDLAGNPRVVDGDSDGTAVVDMGAYESQSWLIHNITQDRWYVTIQAAIDDASDDDEIEVAPGTYNEAIDFKGKAVRLYSSGGPEVTTIDGTGNYHVVQCVSGEDANTILQGFTITGGYASDFSYFDNCGGGMYNRYNSSPTVTNCTFSGNSADSWGGAMFNSDSSPTVTNCTFIGNTANISGGGMYNYGGSNPTVTDCNFSGNFAASNGGAMYNSDSSPMVSNCTFSGNTANTSGGGMYNDAGGGPAEPTVINCNFSQNSADNGGGMFNYYYYGSPKVKNCTFTGNSADYGGGMYNDDNSPTVTNCTFSGNSADTDGAGMYNRPSSMFCSPTVTNCTFSGNSASDGGGMFNYMYSQSTVANCIFWGNTPDEIYDDGSSTTTVSYSDVKGGWGGAGNIDADPCFVDAAAGNLRLGLDSPCIDAADNNSVPGSVTTDLNSFPRFIDDLCTADTGNGTAPIVDMGAYEFLPADIDGSGAVDLSDLARLALRWAETGCGRCGGANITCDGDVDWNDLRELTDWWLAGK